MNDASATGSPPPLPSPGSAQNLPPIPNGPAAFSWAPLQALFFVLGIGCVFLFTLLANAVAVADGGGRGDEPLGEVVGIGLVIAYFAISAVGMTFARARATLIKFAVAAHLPLLMFCFLMTHETLTKYVQKPVFSYNNVRDCAGLVLFFQSLLSPWHLVWIFKLFTKEKRLR
jgi:hypothetical protein